MNDTPASQLPNGFHDAFLRRLSVNYTERTLTLDVDFCYGDPDGSSEAEREAYRRGEVVISGLVWCIIEPPAAQPTAMRSEGAWIDAGPVSDLKKKPALPEVPAGAFLWWLFNRDSNSFIYIAATDASLNL
jgi:hypothetical protein